MGVFFLAWASFFLMDRSEWCYFPCQYALPLWGSCSYSSRRLSIMLVPIEVPNPVVLHKHKATSTCIYVLVRRLQHSIDLPVFQYYNNAPTWCTENTPIWAMHNCSCALVRANLEHGKNGVLDRACTVCIHEKGKKSVAFCSLVCLYIPSLSCASVLNWVHSVDFPLLGC